MKKLIATTVSISAEIKWSQDKALLETLTNGVLIKVSQLDKDKTN